MNQCNTYPTALQDKLPNQSCPCPSGPRAVIPTGAGRLFLALSFNERRPAQRRDRGNPAALPRSMGPNRPTTAFPFCHPEPARAPQIVLAPGCFGSPGLLVRGERSKKEGSASLLKIIIALPSRPPFPPKHSTAFVLPTDLE